MSLLDQYGRSIPAAEIRRLRQEEATPTLAGVRPAFSFHQADNITPAKLASIHRLAAHGDGRAYMELAEDIEERDLHYSAVLRTRRLSVAGLPMTVEAASDDARHQEHADFIRRWLDECVLEEALFDILDAVGKGYSVHEIIWQTEPDRIWPKQFIYRPQRWFDPDRVDGETIMLREATFRQPLLPHKFLVHRHPSKSGLVLRSGLARVASWAFMWKSFTLRDWAGFVQNYGQPLRLGRYGPESTSEDRAVLWSAVANIAGDCAAIVPRGMEIEFVEVGDLKAGSDLYERRADWLDRQVSKLVLGQTTTTDAVSGGHAVSREHRLVQEDIERADARMLRRTLARQIIQTIIAFNFGPQDAYPRLQIGRPEEIPLASVIDGVARLVPLGLRVEQGDLRDRMGLKDPEEGAELLAPAASREQRAPGTTPAPAAPGAKPPDLENDAEDPTDTKALNAIRRDWGAPSARRRAAQQLATPEAVEVLTARLAQDAEGALAGLTGEIRAELEAATDMQDLARRIARMQLDPKALALAMGRGMAIAHLAGQAALLDEIAPPAPAAERPSQEGGSAAGP
jgi:phage gp29-like protein